MVQFHGIPPCARSSKRAGRPIPCIALDQCRVPERYRTRVPIFVPVAQSTERARPKRQVAGENPAGDTIFCGCGSTAECGRAKAETTVRFRPPAPFRGRSSSAERSFDMREAERAALSAPTIFEGIAQSAEWMRHMHQVRRREPFYPHHLSLWCSPDDMPASHAGDHRSEVGQGRQFSARGSRGIADPPDSESGSLGRASRLAPTSLPSKHCQRCVRSVSESARCNSE